jgi:hypothetical protein
VDAKRYVRVKVSFSESELEQLRAEAKAEGRTLAGLLWARALRIEERKAHRFLEGELAAADAA